MKVERMAALSFDNRQRAQTSWAVAPLRQTSTHPRHLLQQHQRQQQQHQQLLLHQRQQRYLLGRRQFSFIEASSSSTCVAKSSSSPAAVNGQPPRTRSALVHRGASVDRCDLTKHSAQPKVKRTSFQLQRHAALNQAIAYTFEAAAAKEQRQRSGSLSGGAASGNLLARPASSSGRSSYQKGGAVIKPLHKRDDVRVAWCSTSSLLKAFNDELSSDQTTAAAHRRKNSTTSEATKVKPPQSASAAKATGNQEKAQPPPTATCGDISKINLNIVLSQTIRAIAEFEATHSDVDSCSEYPEPVGSHLASEESSSTTASAERTPSAAAFRRAHFQTRRSSAFNVAATAANCTAAASGATILTATAGTSAVESQSTERRSPLVRAMSAPVRPYEETAKGSIIKSRSKPRIRRKTIARNISCEKAITATTTTTTTISTTTRESSGHDKTSPLDGSNPNLNEKKLLTRTRSTAVDQNNVITLVSLISSELSDSEREEEDNSGAGPAPPLVVNSAEGSHSSRAPLLRKAGKSVSFQENFMYPPNYQLAAKEYSHMIRRGSVAPLATRLRSNRPPTAPVVNIFLSDTGALLNGGTPTMATTNNNNNNNCSGSDDGSCSGAAAGTKCCPGGEAMKSEKENIEEPTVAASDYVYPQYVRSLKERECWKLYQKMSNKGVNVSYETVLRGMLTPTEFRQVQKQRELEEAKLRALDELDKAPEEIGGKQIPAIERLSESLLQK